MFQGNYIGVDIGGTVDLGNATQGIIIDGGADGNTVGGLVAAARNVISGNGNDGVMIATRDSWGSSYRGTAYRNTTADGTAAIRTGAASSIANGATGNTVGGHDSARNLVSGNARWVSPPTA